MRQFMLHKPAGPLLAVASFIVSLAACTSSNETSSPSVAVYETVAEMLDSAAAAWNRGDLDRFVADYAPDSATTFIGSSGILRGRAAIREAYAPRFATPGQQDSLAFDIEDVDQLGSDALHVIAFYRLMRDGQITAQGPTSLVLQRIDGRWMIVHDHSS